MGPELKKSRSTVGKVLKELNWTRKRLKKVLVDRNSPSTIALRAEYSATISAIRDDKLIFVDESGFNLYLSSFYGYSPKGLSPSIGVPSNRGRNISLLA